jgi:hypothetical protein
MTPQEFLSSIIDPGLVSLESVGGPPLSDNARRMLLAIALQESGPQLVARYQNSPSTSPGPARGWWQFEQGGGVTGVLNHSASKSWASKACETCTVVAQPSSVWRSLEGHDDLAVMFARLLLWTDPRPLPTTEVDAWDYYIRNWRPGKPHPENWPTNWKTASMTVGLPLE